MRVGVYVQHFAFSEVTVGEGHQLLFSVLNAELSEQDIGGCCG